MVSLELEPEPTKKAGWSSNMVGVKSLHKKWLEITKHPLKEGGNAFTALDGSEIRQTS